MSLAISIVSLNCGREQVDSQLFASHLAEVFEDGLPDLLFVSLQEIAPLAYSFIGGSYLDYYYEPFLAALRLIAKEIDYVLVVKENVGLTASLLFARTEIANSIYNVSTGGVGTGVWQMGNKGGVGTRIDFARPTKRPVRLTFLALHLAPHEYNTQRRNEDWENIVRKLVFQPASKSAISQTIDVSDDFESMEDTEESALLGKYLASTGIYVPNTHIFVAGDLNYRTSSRAPTAEDRVLYPKPVSPSSKSHYTTLLRTDQLNAEREAARTMHGFVESDITFEPTYKYSASGRRPDGSGLARQSSAGDTEQWSWAPWRWPSWCDRILYSPPPSWTKLQVKVSKYTSLPLLPSTDHRGVCLSIRLPEEPIPFPPPEVRRSSTDPRVHPPFPIEAAWQLNRATARKLEFVVGIAAWLALSRAGRALLLAIVLGSWGGVWLVTR